MVCIKRNVEIQILYLKCARARNPVLDDITGIAVLRSMTKCHQDPDQGSIKCVTSLRVSCRHEEMLHIAGDGYKRGQQWL